MNIYGAGLAGLLAANMFRKYAPRVYEQSKELPNNHHALLRHRTNKVGNATTIPFREVDVYKSIYSHDRIHNVASVDMMNEYSLKVTGGLLDRSISDLKPVKRYISPSQIVALLAVGCDIKFGMSVTKELILSNHSANIPQISTIPMPIMWKLCDLDLTGLERPAFAYKDISVVNAWIKQIDCDIYQTVYFPEYDDDLYRVSITGNKVIMEFVSKKLPDDMDHQFVEYTLQNAFGIHGIQVSDYQVHQSKYGKIKDDQIDQTRAVVKHITEQFGVYSVGRYALWRNILLDDVHDDLLIVQRFIDNKGYYT